MEQYKLLDVEGNKIYFVHLIKNNDYHSATSQELFNSLEAFGISSSISRVVVIFEISIISKRIDLLILQYRSNTHQTNTSNKNTICEYDSILKRYLMKGNYKLLITYNLINTNKEGVLTIDNNPGYLTGERSFVRKYRLSLDNIIVGYIQDKNNDKENEVGFIEKKK